MELIKKAIIEKNKLIIGKHRLIILVEENDLIGKEIEFPLKNYGIEKIYNDNTKKHEIKIFKNNGKFVYLLKRDPNYKIETYNFGSYYFNHRDKPCIYYLGKNYFFKRKELKIYRYSFEKEIISFFEVSKHYIFFIKLENENGLKVLFIKNDKMAILEEKNIITDLYKLNFNDYEFKKEVLEFLKNFLKENGLEA